MTASSAPATPAPAPRTWTRAPGRGLAASVAPSTSRRRSASVMPSATSRSPTSSASSDRTSRSTGWPRRRSRPCSRRRGERIHPLSAELASESAHITAESSEHDLNAFQAIRRMDEILVANFMVFYDAVEGGEYDLVIGDEAWDIDHFLHENPELKSDGLRLDDRFRRLAADALGRRARGVPDRRLQRRDDRARRALPAPARPGDLRRRSRRHRARRLRPGAAVDPRLDRAPFRVQRLRHRLRSGAAHRASRGAAPGARLPARRTGRHRDGRRLRRRRGAPAPGHRELSRTPRDASTACG